MRPMHRLLRAVRVLFTAAQLFFLAVSLYQSAVTLLGRMRPQPRHLPLTSGGPRFGLIVCARDEATVVSGTVMSLRAQEYPADLYEVLVVAHNCNDNTASLAARAGARVIELNTDRPGKIYPMLAGLQEMGDRCDFIGVFDADSRFPSTLLATVAAAADGEDCIQVEVVPRETDDWLARGYGLGRRSRNVFWWRPREALGLGSTLTGTGFFIRPHLMADLLENPRTLTEDLELTARLYATGKGVAYVSSTYVAVGEPQAFKSSVKQRLRWVRGHFSVIRYDWPKLVKHALKGDARAFDMALYMLVPTRLLTRTAVTGAAGLAILRVPGALPGPMLGVALAGEWVLPSVIAVRERLVPLSRGGISLAIRHGVLSLLWFPIGLWGLLTASVHAWDGSPRAPIPERDDHAVPSS
jgi:cellulose synthase/poly-beta-1,6-N-acetylglucosamine synthase-like glycosyltransferase